MSEVASDWFTETGILNIHNSMRVSLKVDQVLHREKSPFQEILVFQR